jgi:hypothetical protein
MIRSALLPLLFALACSAPQRATSALPLSVAPAPALSCPETPRPAWVDVPKDSCPAKMLCARGTGATDKAALKDARVELAAQVSVTIEQVAERVGHQVVSDRGAAYAERASLHAQEIVKQHLKGSMATDYWCDAKTGARAARAQIAVGDVTESVKLALAAEAQARIGLEERIGLAVTTLNAALPQVADVCLAPLTQSVTHRSTRLGSLLSGYVTSKLAQGHDRGVIPCRTKSLPYRVGGEYFLDEARLTLFVHVTDPRNDQLVQQVTVTVAGEHVPADQDDEQVQGLSAGGAEAMRPVLPPVVGTYAAGEQGEPLRVGLTTNRGKGATFHQGEHLIATVVANRECYAHVFLVDAEGAASLIFPNRWQANNRVSADVPLRLGDPVNRDFVLRVQRPFGMEVLKVIASTRPFTDMETQQTIAELSTTNQPFVASADESATAVRTLLTRGISVDPNDMAVVRPDLSTDGRAEWAESATTYVSAP